MLLILLIRYFLLFDPILIQVFMFIYNIEILLDNFQAIIKNVLLFIIITCYVNCFLKLVTRIFAYRECLQKNAYQMLKAISHTKQC